MKFSLFLFLQFFFKCVTGTREHEFSTTKSHSPIPEEHLGQETSLVVKFKKIRRSELATLNDEAENFMFPRKEDSSFGDLDTDGGPNTTCSSPKDNTFEIVSSECEKRPKFKEESSEDSEEFLDSIALKERFKNELDEKKLKSETEETIGKRRSRRVVDYHEENSESETNIKIRPRKNISYIEESSIDEEIIPQKKNIVLNIIDDSNDMSNQRQPRKKFQIHRYRLNRPYKRKYIKKSEVMANLDETAQDGTALSIVRKRFKKTYCVKRPYKRKYTKKSVVVAENLDETAQDGSVLGDISSRRKRKSDVRLFHDDLDVSKDTVSRDSVSCDSEGRRRKKRSHAELFIEENQKYFKFESPGSRLR